MRLIFYGAPVFHVPTTFMTIGIHDGVCLFSYSVECGRVAFEAPNSSIYFCFRFWNSLCYDLLMTSVSWDCGCGAWDLALPQFLRWDLARG